jgi:hypothetical protein
MERSGTRGFLHPMGPACVPARSGLMEARSVPTGPFGMFSRGISRRSTRARRISETFLEKIFDPSAARAPSS